MQSPAQSVDTETGSFHSGWMSLSRGELAACTLLFLGIPMVLLWNLRAGTSTTGLDIRVQSKATSVPVALHSSTEAARLNLNQATLAALELLPGIGPVRARKIVTYRETHGPFKNVRDLEKVPGLSKSLVTRLESLVTVPTP